MQCLVFSEASRLKIIRGCFWTTQSPILKNLPYRNIGNGVSIVRHISSCANCYAVKALSLSTVSFAWYVLFLRGGGYYWRLPVLLPASFRALPEMSRFTFRPPSPSPPMPPLAVRRRRRRRGRPRQAPQRKEGARQLIPLFFCPFSPIQPKDRKGQLRQGETRAQNTQYNL